MHLFDVIYIFIHLELLYHNALVLFLSFAMIHLTSPMKFANEYDILTPKSILTLFFLPERRLSLPCK